LQRGFDRRPSRCSGRARCCGGAVSGANELETTVNELQAAVRAAVWLAEPVLRLSALPVCDVRWARCRFTSRCLVMLLAAAGRWCFFAKMQKPHNIFGACFVIDHVALSSVSCSVFDKGCLLRR